jgi:membrane protein
MLAARSQQLVAMNYIGILKDTFKNWQKDQSSLWAASLAYYTVFSIAPLLLIVISFAGIFFGKEAVEGQLFEQIRGLIGDGGAFTLQEAVKNASNKSTSIVTSIIGLITLGLGAAGVFGQLKSALNNIWQVKTNPKAGIIHLIKDRFLSFSMVLVISFLLLVSLSVSAFLSSMGTIIGNVLPVPFGLLQLINFLVSIAIISILFSLVFKVLPDVKVSWNSVWIGAILTAILFTLGKLLIGLYIGKSSLVSSYGAAGSLIVILLWVYYSAQILFFGAEFTKVYFLKTKGKITPSENALLKDQNLEEGKEKRPNILAALGGYVISGFLYQLTQKRNKKKSKKKK